jgi:uncharacterized protein (TIGR03118 family)
MTIRNRRRARYALKVAGTVSPALLLVATLSPARQAAAQRYAQTNLVTDSGSGLSAANTDNNLQNAWGIARSAGGDWWVADNNTGLLTLYNGAGVPNALVVTVPESANPNFAAGNFTGVPSGEIFNSAGGSNFAINGHNTNFLYVTEDGTIGGWGGSFSPITQAQIAVDQSGPNITGAVYKGLAIDTVGGSPVLYATDFGQGKVEAFNSSFTQLSLPSNAFVDPDLTPGDNINPFNIENIGGNLFVTYATLDTPPNEFDVEGDGAVAEFSANGTFIEQISAGNGTGYGGTIANMDAPWGLVQAPSDFGKFSNDLLVGQFGNGQIDAFNVSGPSAVYEGTLEDPAGNPLSIDGLWGLEFGGGTASNGPTDSLYFSAGPNNENDGLFGTLTVAAPEPGSLPLAATGLLTLAGLVRRRMGTRRRAAA